LVAIDKTLCMGADRLPDFLRLSRGSVDDSITQNLNALILPGSVPFNPSSTTARQHPSPARAQRAIGAADCDGFKNKVLFPSWQMRSDVLNYCATVATSPDPYDPDHLLREVENLHAREKMVDARLDPYSARYTPREARTESLAALIRNERMVEEIIRTRTWSIIGERCSMTGESFDQAFGRWRTAQERGRDRPK
jgi:hypothetical protein